MTWLVEINVINKLGKSNWIPPLKITLSRLFVLPDASVNVLSGGGWQVSGVVKVLLRYPDDTDDVHKALELSGQERDLLVRDRLKLHILVIRSD